MKKRFGDRKDGKRVRDLGPIHKVMPYLMDKRCDAEVYISEKIDVTNLLAFLEEQNQGLDKGYKMTIFHVFATAMAKTIYERPLLNRFVQGKRHYDRHEISLSFVAKTKLTDNAEEMLIKLVARKDDNVHTIKNFILSKVNKIRTTKTNNMDQTLKLLTSGPRFITSFIVWLIKWLDFRGWLPKSFTDMDPNYSTVLMSNLGSIKCNHAYHHLNNYGTNSILMTIGVMRKEELIINGKKELRDIIEVGLTCDERIADGFYFAKSIILFKYLIENPSVLEQSMSTKVDFNPDN